MQVKKIIEKHATEHILITGEDYPVSKENQFKARAIGILQMILMSLIIFGESICKALGFA